MGDKAHVSLNGMALRGVNVLIDGKPDGRLEIRVDLHVPSRVDGSPIRTSTRTHTNRESVEADTIRETVRGVVLTALGHEIDEWLSIDGVRSDPHSG